MPQPRLLHQNADREVRVARAPLAPIFFNSKISLKNRQVQIYFAALALSPLYASDNRDL
jgi:hypothetical protein